MITQEDFGAAIMIALFMLPFFALVACVIANGYDKMLHHSLAKQHETQEAIAVLAEALNELKAQQKPKRDKAARRKNSKSRKPNKKPVKAVEFEQDCIDALIALGTPKSQAKTVAKQSIRRNNPKTVQEFITKTLVNPN